VNDVSEGSRTVTRVLLIEDDEQDYIVTRDLLAEASSQRFVLQWVTRLADGIAASSAGGVDVILLDFSLPDSRGWATFEKVRDHAPNIPIIMLTGLDDETISLRAMKEGAQDYLFKGTTNSALLTRAIRYAIERKRVELSLKQYQEHLEELVADRTTELTWANAQLQHEVEIRRRTEEDLKEALRLLQAHDKAKSDFVSNVSHELKTPLATITYAVANLLRGVMGPIPERMIPYVRMMKEDCIRLTGTINDILDMSRIDAKRLVLNMVRVPFAHVARRAVESLRIQAENKGLKMELIIGSRVGFVLCDPHRIERVMFNIINNAIKFTESGEIVVDVRLDEEQDSFIRMTVVDTGVGIAAEHLPRITERYFRVEEHISGSGLGLSLSKDLIEMHSGMLGIASPPPGRAQGTSVSVWLPLSAAPSVLALDPDIEILRALQNQLEGQGYQVQAFISSREAMESLAHQKPDAVIVDAVGPEAAALEMVGRLRANPQMQMIPVIVMTGKESSRVHAEIFRNLRVPAVEKPVVIEDLLLCLERAISSGRETGALAASLRASV
jgi:signal transduction histidine kinase